MFKSMTGFGRAEKQLGNYTCKVEIRSVNNRFLEVKTRIPKNFASLELPLKKLIKSKCARGTVDCSVTLQKNDADGITGEIRPNLPLATQYHGALIQIRESLGLSGEIDLNSLLSFKDLIQVEPTSVDEEKEELVLSAAEDAMNELLTMRRHEGDHLQTDILQRLDEIETCKEAIMPRQQIMVEQYKERLKERIQALLDGAPMEESRLAQEVALMADRCDITEEITRLESHLNHFRQLAESEEPIGRKLEFLIQEFNRETNTIGSKAIDLEISKSTIEIKSILEKIREQLANIE
ncbi:MAG: YicC family protein [Candidatus Nitrohelix vancouverensis]|uniref:YicC family protein n=1 Tax=Candidatus Nitrohelix vancouverensis TaxID=2705534 RepID=A0A7T0C399_9BACT|nr:MAG: YicC family protein [Candidatus Nitrohelix vancouverensis]